MKRRVRPARPPGRLVPAILIVAIAAVGFAMLMIRLEVTQEGYRLSALDAEILSLQNSNRNLRLKAAELASHERLRSLAPRYNLAPPAPGSVVVMP
jgi:cell division protein FtsL